VPVTVTVVGPPVVVVLLAVSVSTLVVDVLVGLKAAVTPVGSVEVTARLTASLKPFVGFTVIVLMLVLPCTMLTVLGAADSVKFGGGVTVKATVVVSTECRRCR